MSSPSPAGRTLAEAAAARAAILRATCCAAGETQFAQVAERVGRAVAQAEPAGQRAMWAERFAARMRDGLFLPSIPTLANAGRLGQLAACFVLEPADSLDSIYETLARAARIQQRSGGAGIHFSKLRPRGASIARTAGVSPGPVAFVELFAHSARVNALAGRRPGAHLAILRDDHPDIVDFVRAKASGEAAFAAIGLAVGVSDALLEAARRGGDHALQHPRGGAGQRLPARELLSEISRSIVRCGEPTLLFLGSLEATNPTPWLGPLEATNPCGEQPLLPDESCVLASLALPKFLRADGQLDAGLLREVVHDAIRFLDDVVETNSFPDEAIEKATRQTRKLGLGVMGLADCLLQTGVRYGSVLSQDFADRGLAVIQIAAAEASEALARERGAYPAFRGPGPARRNASTLAVAPTGTLRLLAGCSGGIEPLLDPVLPVRCTEGELRWVDSSLLAWLDARRIPPGPVLEALAEGRGGAQLPGLAPADRDLLALAWEVAPEEQIAIQARVQTHVDGAVSKTVHLPASATAAQVEALIALARASGCKGLACFRRAPGVPPACIDLSTAAAVCRVCGDA